MNLEIGNVLLLVQAYGPVALLFVGILLLGKDLIKRGFSIRVDVGPKR